MAWWSSGGGRRDGNWDRSGVTRHRLAILPNTTHYDIFMSPLLAPVVAPFLDAAVSERAGPATSRPG